MNLLPSSVLMKTFLLLLLRWCSTSARSERITLKSGLSFTFPTGMILVFTVLCEQIVGTLEADIIVLLKMEK